MNNNPPPGEEQTSASPSPVSAPAKKGKSPIVMIVVIFVLFIFGLGIGAGGGILLYSQLNKDDDTKKDETTQETTVEADDNDDTVTNDKDIVVTSPKGDDDIDGRVEVTGSAKATLQMLTVAIYDNNDVLLGTDDVDLASGDPNPMHDWTTYVDITKSPGTLTGRLVVFPKDEGIDSDMTVRVVVKFKQAEEMGRVRLFAPLDNQVLSEMKVMFKGQMKDFFEGTMSIRLKDESGTVIFTDIITASDNYDKYADFQKEIDVERIPVGAGDTGTWEIYEVDQSDGSEDVLLTIDVRFSE